MFEIEHWGTAFSIDGVVEIADYRCTKKNSDHTISTFNLLGFRVSLKFLPDICNIYLIIAPKILLYYKNEQNLLNYGLLKWHITCFNHSKIIK